MVRSSVRARRQVFLGQKAMTQTQMALGLLSQFATRMMADGKAPLKARQVKQAMQRIRQAEAIRDYAEPVPGDPLPSVVDFDDVPF
jgi:hypothetical protein